MVGLNVTTPRWTRLEIVCGAMSGIFREDSRGKHELVPFYGSDLPCISLELVDDDGKREGVGLTLSPDLDKARVAAEKLGRLHSVPVVDLSRNIISARQ